MATTIGKLSFLVAADSSGVSTGLKVGQSAIQRFSGIVTGFASQFGALFGGFTIAAVIRQFATMGDELHDMSGRTGVAASELAGLKFAAEQSGATIQDVEMALRRMAKGGFDVSKFDQIAAQIAAIEDPSKRAAKAMEVFGKSGTMLIPMLANLKALKAEAAQRGLIPSEASVKAAGEIADAFNTVKAVAGTVAFEIGAAFAPQIKATLDLVADMGTKTIKALRSIGQTITDLQPGTLRTTISMLSLVGGFAAGIAIAPRVIAAVMGIVKVLRALATGQAIAQALSGPKGWVTLGIGLAVAAAAGVAVDQMFTAIDASGGKAAATSRKVAAAFGEVEEEAKAAKDAVKALADQNRNIAQTVNDTVAGNLHFLNMQADELGDKLKAITDQHKKAQDEISGRKFTAAAERFTSAGAAAEDNARRAQEVATQLKVLNDTFKARTKPIEKELQEVNKNLKEFGGKVTVKEASL